MLIPISTGLSAHLGDGVGNAIVGNLSGVRAVGGVGGQDLGRVDGRALVVRAVVGGGTCNEGSGSE